jgi:hypothetical protein
VDRLSADELGAALPFHGEHARALHGTFLIRRVAVHGNGIRKLGMIAEVLVRGAGAFLAASMAALLAQLVASEASLAAMALAVNPEAGLLLHPFPIGGVAVLMPLSIFQSHVVLGEQRTRLLLLDPVVVRRIESCRTYNLRARIPTDRPRGGKHRLFGGRAARRALRSTLCLLRRDRWSNRRACTSNGRRGARGGRGGAGSCRAGLLFAWAIDDLARATNKFSETAGAVAIPITALTAIR